MIGIFLLTHSTYGEALIQCACHVLNKRPPQIAQLGIAAQDDPLDSLPLARDMLQLVDGGRGVLHADHRRDRQAARDDGGVRGAAAHVGDETADPEGLELEGVGRRKVVGHHDQVVLGSARLAFHQPALPALQHLEHALDHLHDVLLALAQVGILEFVELVDHQLHLLHHGPFGIAAAFADQLAHAVGQRRIGQDHGMDIDEGGQLGRRPGHAGVRAQGVELGAGGAHGAVEALQLACHVAFAQLVVRDLQRRVRNQVRAPDRDAARDRLAVEAEGHSSSPNLPAISAWRAAAASSARSPAVSMITVEPLPAASIITPMMLLALMRRLPRSIQTSHGKEPASWVSLAEARACRPSLLVISASMRGISVSAC